MYLEGSDHFVVYPYPLLWFKLLLFLTGKGTRNLKVEAYLVSMWELIMPESLLQHRTEKFGLFCITRPFCLLIARQQVKGVSWHI